MEDNPDLFPEQNINNILRKIKSKATNYPSLQDYCVDLLCKLDKNNDGVINFEEFTAGLRSYVTPSLPFPSPLLPLFIADNSNPSAFSRFEISIKRERARSSSPLSLRMNDA